MGIEPTYPAWKAGVLPLNYTRGVGVTGFEPATSWSQTRRSSQTEPHPEVFRCLSDNYYTITYDVLFVNTFFNFYFNFYIFSIGTMYNDLCHLYFRLIFREYRNTFLNKNIKIQFNSKNYTDNYN